LIAQKDSADSYQFVPSIDNVPYKNLKETWEIAQTHLLRKNFEQAISTVEEINRIKMKLGLLNIFEISDILIKESENLLAEKNLPLSQKFANFALIISPDHPYAHFQTAKLLLYDDFSNFGKVFYETMVGILASVKNLPVFIVKINNFVLFLISSLLIAAVFFALCQFLRYFRLMSHEIKDLFPRGVSYFQSSLLLFIVCFLPFVFNFGILVLILTWLTFFSIHQQIKEKVISIVSIIIIGCIPFAGRILSAMVNFEDSIVKSEYSCLYSLCSEDNVAKLRKESIYNETDPLPREVLGIIMKRNVATGAANTGDAEYYFAGAVKTGGNNTRIYNNLGNLYVISSFMNCQMPQGVKPGDMLETKRIPSEQFQQKAMDYYDRAIKSDPEFAKAVINRINLAKEIGLKEDEIRLSRFSEKDEYINDMQHLQSLRSDVANLDRCQNPHIGNRLTLDAVPSAFELLSSRFSISQGETLFPFKGILFGRIPESLILILSSISILLIFLFSFFVSQISLTAYCPVCGEISCPRCNRDFSGFSFCSSCLLAQIKSNYMDALEMWSKERKIYVSRRRKILISKIMSVFYPGLGQIYIGKSGSGFMLSLIFSMCIYSILLPDGFFREVSYKATGSNTVVALIPYIIAAVIYLFSLINIFRKT
jgi:tetratricopeptide (TPR) repeat protein